MIIDCFTFFNELELLEARLEYLDDIVDYFVIVESDTTFSGQPKPLNYLPNAAKYQKYLHKIVYFPYAADVTGLTFNKVEQCDYESAPWKVEFMQRDYIANALKFFSTDDIVLMGDLDEVPSKDSIRAAIGGLGTAADAFALEQQLFYYNFAQRQIQPWKGTVVTTNKFLQANGAQWLRDMRWVMPSVYNGGVHLSYWGSPEKIATKIQSFAHQELNKDQFTDHTEISKRITEGRDPFDRQPLEAVDINTIPHDIYDVFNKYAST
jgi:beta-1,4-mannosyl-glycoprotein beta-1,4-N-acetylglucosaminyltransferase